MGDGKYGAVAGLIGRMQMMDNISEHLAATRTHAYKKGVPTFHAELAEAQSGMASKGVNFVRVSGETIDFTPGQLEFTGEPLHVGINGDGFFQIEQADGTFGYTRRGTFKLDPEGVLIDGNNQPVMSAGGGAMTLPGPDVDIASDGNIWYNGEQIARIAVFQFDDNAILQRAPKGIFLPSDGSQPEPHPAPQLVQNNLETSNVDMMRTMVRMNVNLRAFEATQKALRIYSDMGSKAAEIGLVQ
ncbi:MAG: flagellar hook-basal body complex protein [Desulfuromonadaceae bacterium]|nr:flagellar hook-basal body complex protein [Desulfuromonadaceae bacterium]